MQAPSVNPYAPPSTDEVAAPRHDGEQRTASPGSRFLASLLDGLLNTVAVFAGVALAGSAPWTFFTELAGRDADELELAEMLVVLLPALAGLLLVNAYQWHLLTTTGQSLGKKWLQIRVVRKDGGPAGFVHAVLLRVWLVYLLLYVPALGDLWALALFVGYFFVFTETGRTLHDVVAGTRVVEADF